MLVDQEWSILEVDGVVMAYMGRADKGSEMRVEVYWNGTAIAFLSVDLSGRMPSHRRNPREIWVSCGVSVAESGYAVAE